MSKTKTLVARWATILQKASAAFFDISGDDTVLLKAGKVAWTGVKRSVYSVADYWLAIASGVYIIAIDQTLHWGWFGLFSAMFAFDMIVAIAFLIIWKVTGEDVTLGEAYRRAADVVHSESKIAGVFAFTGVCVKAAFWDGPEHIVIFFYKELRTWYRMSALLVLLVVVQAAIWTPIYVLGFETVSQLFQYLWNLF